MTEVTKSFGYQLDILVNYIQANYRCESPQSAFARYVFNLNSSQIPFDIACDGVMQSMKSRFHEAPVLATFGYELACGTVVDNTLQESWVKGLARLASRDAFPSDRASFFYRPIELLGICVGVSNCKMVRSEDRYWLQDILAQGQQKLANCELWTFLVSSYAARKLSLSWESTSLPLIDNISFDELALIKWICNCNSELAQSLSLDRIETKVEKELLNRSLTKSIMPSDVSRAAIIYLVLKSTIETVFNHQWFQYSNLGLNLPETVNYIQTMYSQLKMISDKFDSNIYHTESNSNYFINEILKLLPNLQSHIQDLHSKVRKAAEDKSNNYTVNNNGILVTQGDFVMNDNKNQNEIQQNFYSAVHGVAGKVEGNQNIFVSEQKQTLAEAAQEIRQLLIQLEASNPTATEIQKVEFVKAAIAHTRRERFSSALNAGWKETIKELLDNKFINVAIAVLEGWKNAGM